MIDDRCLVYIGYDIPDGNASSVRVFSNALALKEFGYKVFILSFDEHTDHLSFNINKCTEINGIIVLRAKMPSYKSIAGLKFLFGIRYITQILDEIKKENRVDAIIAYNHPSFSYDKLVNYAKKNRIKIIADCTEWHTALHHKGIIRVIKEIEIINGMNRSYQKSDGIVCISREMQKYFTKNKTLLVPPLQFEKANDSYKENNSNIRRFIYAGIPGTDKDRLDLIINVFLRISLPYQLDIYGVSIIDFGRIYSKNNNELLKIMNNKSIIFHGKVSHSEIIEKLKTSDFSLIFRNSSRKNNFGFPTKYAEAITAGVPVIVTNFSDVAYYTQKYQLGLCVENDNEIKDVVTQAILDDIKLEKMRNNCKSTKLFYYSSYIEKLGNFIQELSDDKKSI